MMVDTGKSNKGARLLSQRHNMCCCQDLNQCSRLPNSHICTSRWGCATTVLSIFLKTQSQTQWLSLEVNFGSSSPSLVLSLKGRFLTEWLLLWVLWGVISEEAVAIVSSWYKSTLFQLHSLAEKRATVKGGVVNCIFLFQVRSYACWYKLSKILCSTSQEERWHLSLDWAILCQKTPETCRSSWAQDSARQEILLLSCWHLRAPTTPLSYCKPFKDFACVFLTPMQLTSLAQHFFLCKHVLLNKRS